MSEQQFERPENFDIQDVIDYLINNQHLSLKQALQNLYEVDESIITDKDREVISTEIFNCEGCGFWYGVSEQEDEGLCGDCYEKSIDDLNEDE